MKTHILFTLLTAFFLTACASHEGRDVSSTADTQEEQQNYSHLDANGSREIGRQ